MRTILISLLLFSSSSVFAQLGSGLSESFGQLTPQERHKQMMDIQRQQLRNQEIIIQQQNRNGFQPPRGTVVLTGNHMQLRPVVPPQIRPYPYGR